MFGVPLKFDFLHTEYIDYKCKDCNRETVHIVRTDHFECKDCGFRND